LEQKVKYIEVLSVIFYATNLATNDIILLSCLQGNCIKGQFSLYDMVVTNNENNRLGKGTYELQVFYGANSSNTITLTVN